MRLIPLNEPPRVCGYLPDRDATYESYLLLEATQLEREQLLTAGYRFFGKYVFRPRCGICAECVPLRVPVEQFCPSKSQKRVWRRSAHLQVLVDKPKFSDEKLEIYRDHLRRFPQTYSEGGVEDFVFSFYDSSTPAYEFTYYCEGKLIGVGIVQKTPHALSSVYFTYRLAYQKLSLGIFSVLTEIEYAKKTGCAHLYLGYYVQDNHFMNYKAGYCPNEVLTSSGQWTPFYNAKRKALLHHPEFIPFPLLDRQGLTEH